MKRHSLESDTCGGISTNYEWWKFRRIVNLPACCAWSDEINLCPFFCFIGQIKFAVGYFDVGEPLLDFLYSGIRAHVMEGRKLQANDRDQIIPFAKAFKEIKLNSRVNMGIFLHGKKFRLSSKVFGCVSFCNQNQMRWTSNLRKAFETFIFSLNFFFEISCNYRQHKS